ncbi:MAG: hypothetical protein JW867_06570 [Candidatus Omnitrophica bacterium]|nr:hypothetical protein [Candidatus Omnitrophota bacterium]
MRKILFLNTLICSLAVCLGAVVVLAPNCQAAEDFYIYADKNSPGNHFIPSGWMGDVNDMKFNDQETKEKAGGTTSIKITYTAKKSQNQGWAGIYWQSSQNNWGSKDSGFDLSDFNKLVFMAKGEKDGEVLTTVKVGGITTNGTTGEPVEFPDTLNVEIGPIRLTSDWKEYSINLVDKDLTNVNGGLAIIFNADHTGVEQTVYLDEIRFVNDPDLQKEASGVSLPFYVYADSGSLDNHFIPSGWMPASAARDLKLDTNWKNYPFSGDTCMRLEYKNNSGTRWAGIFWQQPANNWGTIPGAGYDLQGASKLTFWARGDKGDEVIQEFKIGGISSGEYIDSDSSSIGPISLTKEWKQYEIDLRGKDLSYIIGGFAWATNIDVNDPEGIVFYIDEIKYEK